MAGEGRRVMSRAPTAGIAIREMTRRDIPGVAILERTVFPTPWSARIFFDELSMANRAYLVAEDAEGDLLGYAGLLLVESDAHITTLAVEPRARRHRLGSRLMLALVDRALTAGASHLTLEVRMSNEAAQHLYRRFGFAPVGLRKDYYRDEDALIMWAIDIDTPEYGERINEIRRTLEEDRA